MPSIFVLLRRWLRRWLPSSVTATDTLNASLREISVVGGGGGGGLFGPRDKEARRSGAVLPDHISSNTKTSSPSLPVLSLKRSRTVSSMASQEYMLTSVSTGTGRDDASIRGGKGDDGRTGRGAHHNDVFPTAGCGRSSGSLRRGEGGGIRKQVDIIVVEEALQELGMAVRRAERLDRQHEAAMDVERDAAATQKPLPSLPDQVYRW